MPSQPGLDVTITGGKQLQELAKKLKDPAQKQLRTELRKSIQNEAKPLVAELQRAVLAIESKVDGKSSLNSGETARAVHAGSRKIESKRSHGLRATIARSIQVKVRTTASQPGVQIRVDPSKLPETQRNLPKALDTSHWRHPVFGNREVWVQQTGKPWWSVTIKKRKDEVRGAILAAMKTVADKIRE